MTLWPLLSDDLDKLYYTALATVIYVTIAVMMLVGMSTKFAMNPIGWAAVSCKS